MANVSWWRTSFPEEEIQSISDAISNEHVSQGPVTLQFEEQFAKAMDVPYAVATTSGSVALLMALMALGIGPEDEVIVPNRTWIATAHAPLLLGAKVVLVDVQPDTPLMDAASITDKITPRTKAIMPVHLNGRAVEMDEVSRVARDHGLFVIEDACQAMFSENAEGFLGAQSDVGCFSLGVTKLISTGQGGLLITRSEDIYNRLKLIRNNGVVDTLNPTYLQPGCNFKFNDILAAVGMVQLSRAPARIAHVREVFRIYETAIEGLPFLELVPVNLSQGEVPLYVEVLCRERDKLRGFLESHGIETRPFLPDLHTAPYLNSAGPFPHSRAFAEFGMFLPGGPTQPLGSVNLVTDALRKYGRNQ